MAKSKSERRPKRSDSVPASGANTNCARLKRGKQPAADPGRIVKAGMPHLFDEARQHRNDQTETDDIEKYGHQSEHRGPAALEGR